MAKAFIVTGLGYGDEGKGTITDYLCRREKADLVVRFNGGCQAGHRVVLPDGRSHVFSQFGSGTLIPGVKTYLSRYMLLDPMSLVRENAVLENNGITDAFERLTVSRDATVITPFHAAANRLREMWRDNLRHGSCGRGIGEVMQDAIDFPELRITAGEMATPKASDKLQAIQLQKRNELANIIDRYPTHRDSRMLEDSTIPHAVYGDYTRVAKRLHLDTPESLQQQYAIANSTTVFEGAQGVLLDATYGFHPHTTWSNTTFDNALTLLQEGSFAGEITRVGVTRAYATRHGVGPFVTHSYDLTKNLPDPTNTKHPWQGSFRVGWLDMPALRYAIDVCKGVDQLAVTCLDRLEEVSEGAIVCRDYEGHEGVRISLEPGKNLEEQALMTRYLLEAVKPRYGSVVPANEYLEYIADGLRVPVKIVSRGPTWQDKTQL